jgi:precorrin-2/cobalt-factor-2 C20-methyltransferase
MATPAIGTPTLIGVGVGPGDPELVTLKAVAVFEVADVILVPATEASGREAGRAEQLVLAVCAGAATKLQRVPFSMAQRSGIGTKRRQSWMASAKAAEQAFADGATTVAFATVGDPSVYSTFSYLAAHVREAVPGLTVSVVPGITAMQALAAVSLTPLVEGTESLTLVPVTAGMDAVATALDTSDTVVAYKGGRQFKELLALIRAHGRDGILGVDVGLASQRLVPLSEVGNEQVPYFATVIVAPVRTETGGRL